MWGWSLCYQSPGTGVLPEKKQNQKKMGLETLLSQLWDWGLCFKKLWDWRFCCKKEKVGLQPLLSKSGGWSLCF